MVQILTTLTYDEGEKLKELSIKWNMPKYEVIKKLIREYKDD